MAPRGLPLLGHVLQLALPSRLRFIQSLRTHGPVVQLRLGPRRAYVLTSPEAMRQLLQVQAKKFTKGRLFEKSRPFIGDGVLTTDGDVNRRQRRAMQPAFHRPRIASYAPQMQAVTARHISTWQSGQVLDVQRDMRTLAGSLISHVLFSDDLASELSTTVEEALPIVQAGVNWRVLGPGSLFAGLPTPGNRRFSSACTRLWQTTDDLIKAYRSSTVERSDLVSLLMAAPDPHTGGPMSDTELRDEIITIFIAGIETVATTMSWALHVLSTRDDIARRLVDVPYLQAFINEVLRYYTPNVLLMRNTTEAVEIEGTAIPPGAEVLYSPAALHRDPSLYPNPSHFDPSRWLRRVDLPKCAFIPFGMGTHRCVGDNLALAELQVVLTTLVAQWRFVPITKVREVAAILVHPSPGFALRLQERS
ncbi:cytochrome P450 [Lentzea sp. NBRC 105346]|uniref:cytochrome P450 n=1 Tax=Lentzea sp. NBRC 105346 TaxID=3032205 RepID=UPI0025532EE9|nr:cytochrome P450 [Lentzea sp. NBRC 105346]GLZ33931.1 cytochrome P450 [Lentzea sp. NBRC 105346]